MEIQYGKMKMSLNQSVSSDSVLNWDLINRTVSLQKKSSIADSHDEIMADTIGSQDWLWSESDVLRFDKNSLRATNIKLIVSHEVYIDELSLEISKGTFFDLKLNKDSLDFQGDMAEISIFNEKSNQLFGLYDGSQTNNLSLVNLHTNLALLLQEENIVVGWVLSEASNFIGGEVDVDHSNLKGNELLKEYLSLCNEMVYELMEDEDPEVKTKLDQLLEKVRTRSSSIENSIFEGIAGFLDGYY